MSESWCVVHPAFRLKQCVSLSFAYRNRWRFFCCGFLVAVDLLLCLDLLDWEMGSTGTLSRRRVVRPNRAQHRDWRDVNKITRERNYKTVTRSGWLGNNGKQLANHFHTWVLWRSYRCQNAQSRFGITVTKILEDMWLSPCHRQELEGWIPCWLLQKLQHQKKLSRFLLQVFAPMYRQQERSAGVQE